MSSIHAKVMKLALSVTAATFIVLVSLGCSHANTTAAHDSGAQTSNQAQTSPQTGQTSDQTGMADQGSQTPDQNSNQASQAQDLVKFSHNGHAAIDAIQSARVAIFNGHPQAAVQLMDKAKTSIDAAEREAPDFKLPRNAASARTSAGNRNNNQGATLVPVDARISLAEDYAATPEKQSHIDKANQHLKNGETKQAMDELKLAGVNVNYTLLLMPIASSRQDLQKAITLAGQGKYYEANLALKSLEDNLLIDRESLFEVPKNGSKSSTNTNGSSHTGAPVGGTTTR